MKKIYNAQKVSDAVIHVIEILLGNIASDALLANVFYGLFIEYRQMRSVKLRFVGMIDGRNIAKRHM